MIFTFGSNEAGRHGKGSALHAKQQHGAKYGQGFGRQGNSFGIPTKNGQLIVLSVGRIRKYIQLFIQYAQQNPDLKFQVLQIGCGLAGYDPSDIAPLFKTAPLNCYFHSNWKKFLTPKHKFWNDSPIN